MGYTAWNCTERSLPCGRQAVVFPPSLAMDNLEQVCPGGDQTGVLPPFCEATPIVFCLLWRLLPRLQCKRLALWEEVLSLQPIGLWRVSTCLGTRGILFPLLPGHQTNWWVPPNPQPMRPQLVYSSCQVPHGDPHFHSSGSSQRLVDGVAGSQGRLFACADTPQSLAVSSVCSQEPGRGAHCLSMESSPFWLSHCPQSFYQTPGSVSSSPALAGMSDVSVHR